ncbi:MAG: spondin domain-containing protein [Pseudomonadota bacterium]
MTELRITVRNTSETGGTFLTPFYFGFHDGSFDLFNEGEAASAGLESLAEDGATATLGAERAAASPGSQGAVVFGAGGPIATQEQASAIVSVNGALNTSVSYAAMILPSNDAFVGSDEALVLFDGAGNFTGAQTVSLSGQDVYDAGTEVNTELEAAFINQTGPNTGETEGGVVQKHPGFIGSESGPDGTPIILGGTNAAGAFIDPVAADFTRDGAQIVDIHINEYVERTGTSGRDFIVGDSRDDGIDGGAGRDYLVGKGGYDVISGGDGRDFISGGSGDDELSGDGGNDKVLGGSGRDLIDGGAGRDWLSGGSGDDGIHGGDGRDYVSGGRGNDGLSGGAGRDLLLGGRGEDVLNGGTGNDKLIGGRDSDTFVFNADSGIDWVWDFDVYDDAIALVGTALTSFEDVLDNAHDVGRSSVIKVDDGDAIYLRGVSVDDLSASNFDFA